MMRAKVAYRFSSGFCTFVGMMKRLDPTPAWMLKRLPEVQVIRKGDEVTVIVPHDLRSWEVGILIDEALRRARLHPNQLQ